MASQGLRDKKNAEVKRALFRSAMELFRAKGFEETSVEAIAHRAGFSRATFFNHFGTKDGVLRYYGEHIAERMHGLLAEARPGTPPLERVRQMLFQMGREAETHREDLQLVLLHSLKDPQYLIRPTPARLRVLEMMCELVSEAQRAGQVRADISAREQALHIMAIHQGVVARIVGGHMGAEAALDSAWRFIQGALAGADRGDPVA